MLRWLLVGGEAKQCFVAEVWWFMESFRFRFEGFSVVCRDCAVNVR